MRFPVERMISRLWVTIFVYILPYSVIYSTLFIILIIRNNGVRGRFMEHNTLTKLDRQVLISIW